MQGFRGTKPRKFPGSNFLRTKTFRKKCGKLFLTTSLESVCLPLTCVNAFRMMAGCACRVVAVAEAEQLATQHGGVLVLLHIHREGDLSAGGA